MCSSRLLSPINVSVNPVRDMFSSNILHCLCVRKSILTSLWEDKRSSLNIETILLREHFLLWYWAMFWMHSWTTNTYLTALSLLRSILEDREQRIQLGSRNKPTSTEVVYFQRGERSQCHPFDLFRSPDTAKQIFEVLLWGYHIVIRASDQQHTYLL